MAMDPLLMQHFRDSVIILCTKVKARDIFQQQCRSSSRSTKVLHRPIQGTSGHTPILIVPILWRPWRREKLLANFWKMGARPLQYIQFFYYLGNYVDNAALTPSVSQLLLSKAEILILYFVYKPQWPESLMLDGNN